MRRHAPWTVWLLATLASFAWLERRAITERSFPTLSETLRAWSLPFGHSLPVAFIGFWTWLVLHIVTFVPGEDRSGYPHLFPSE